MPGKGRATLIVTYPGCILFEVMLAAELVHPTFPVRVASPNGDAATTSGGLEVVCNLPYRDVDPSDYACILVPGGNPDSIMESPEIDRIVARAPQSTLLAGICAGVLVLAKTGVLRQRRVTHNYTAEYAPPEVVAATSRYWDGAIFEAERVQVDANVITAVPWAYVDFAIAVAAQLGVCDADQAETLARWYGGEPPRPRV